MSLYMAAEGNEQKITIASTVWYHSGGEPRSDITPSNQWSNIHQKLYGKPQSFQWNLECHVDCMMSLLDLPWKCQKNLSPTILEAKICFFFQNNPHVYVYRHHVITTSMPKDEHGCQAVADIWQGTRHGEGTFAWLDSGSFVEWWLVGYKTEKKQNCQIAGCSCIQYTQKSQKDYF